MNSKQLGKGFEREAAHLFTRLLKETGHIREDQAFYRVTDSGMLSHHRPGVSSALMETMVGDVYGPSGWPFVIECKRLRSNPGFHQIILKNTKHPFFGWINQVCEDALKVNKHPLLITKFLPSMGTYVTLPFKVWKLWQPLSNFEPNFLYFHYQVPQPENSHSTYPEHSGLWITMSWNLFARIVKEDYDQWLKNQMSS